MKKMWLLCIAIVLFGLVFIGCPMSADSSTDTPADSPTDSSADTPAGNSGSSSSEYNLSVASSVLTVDLDSTNTIVVTTNGTYSVAVDDESIVTASFEANTITITGKKLGSTYITITCVEDATKTAEVTITVESTKMKLSLNYASLTAKENVKSISVHYGADTGTYADVQATLSNTYTAEVSLSKQYANASGWFNGIVLTLKDSSGSEIPARWKDSNGDIVDYFEYNENGVSLEAIDAEYQDAILTLSFTGFEIPGGSVTVRIGENDPITATLATDGKSASCTVNNKHANATGWFEAVVVTVTDSDGTELAPKYNSYFEFKAEGSSLELTIDAATYTTLVDAISFTGDGNLQELVSATTFAGITPTKIKVEVASYASAGAGDWWATLTSSSSSWDENKIEIPWDDSIGGYSTSITETDAIAAYTANGLFLAIGSGDTANVSVSYIE